MKKRGFCLLIAVLLLVVNVGCGHSSVKSEKSKKTSSEKQHSAGGSQLLYCASDTLNPYTANTQINRRLCRLVFDSLYEYDSNYQPVAVLAEKAAFAGKTCTVTLRDARFSDGSSVTADDVVFSYNLAKKSSTVFAFELYEVVSVAADGRNVIFQLTRQDPYFLNLLDFPILKTGSNNRADADGVLLPPIGCGKYCFNENGDGLIRSAAYYGTNGGSESIRLVNAPDGESVAHYVEIGATDVYFTDVSDGKIVRMSGKKAEVPMNNLVYIGLNERYAPLQNPQLRYAISTALNRSEICRAAYYNNAVVANGVFHPNFEDTKSLQNLKNTADKKIAIENLEKIGYNKVNGSGFRVNRNGNVLALTLLVNADNLIRVSAARQMAEQLKEIGINLRVNAVSYAAYLAALQSGNFQLYLGEISILPNMDISQLVIPGGSAAFGIVDKNAEPAEESKENPKEETPAPQTEPAQSSVIPTLVNGFYSGDNGIADIASAVLTELPIIPVCYRVGLLFYKENMGQVENVSLCDIYSSIGQ